MNNLEKYRFPIVYVTIIVGIFLSLSIPHLTKYTEIDWEAYMSEVRGPFVENNWNYTQLKGDTGPLVYPAGFVYIFEVLRQVTNDGTNIARAQFIFSVFHCIVIVVVILGIYLPSQHVSLLFIPLTVLSRRIHSIFALRLFNDGVAMMYAYSAVAFANRNLFVPASVFLSIAVSIKMNCILMAPGYAVVLLTYGGLLYVVNHVVLCVLIQLVLAFPFLSTDAWAYISRSFDLGRVFMYKWTVNFKFLSEETFVSRELSLVLLILTLVVWLLFGHFRWGRKKLFFSLLLSNNNNKERKLLRSDFVTSCMLESNFIGVVFSRSMHYQFYSWYGHSLPYLLSSCNQQKTGGWGQLVGVLLFFCIEVSFNVFPAMWWSSLLLQFSHYALLIAIVFNEKPFEKVFVDEATDQEGRVVKTTKQQ